MSNHESNVRGSRVERRADSDRFFCAQSARFEDLVAEDPRGKIRLVLWPVIG